MDRIKLITLIFLLISFGLAQESGTRALYDEARLGLTLQQLLENSKRAGIDLSDPNYAEEQARQNGIPLSTLNEWLRLNEVNQNTTIEISCDGDSSKNATRVVEDRPEPPPIPEEEDCYFGYDIFDQIPESFKPSEFGPVNDGYIINPQDQIRLIAWGATEFQYELEVDKEGRIFVPKVGQFTIANMRLKEARAQLKNWLSSRYQGLAGESPSMFMDLTVTRIKPIKIFVLGEVNNPGGYLLRSLPSAFNAIYSTGGIKTTGSLRNIKIIRDGVVVDTLDMYDYLVDGAKRISHIELRDNDKIFVPVRGKTAYIGCEVMRPCTYELKPGETLKDLIRFGGGITSKAYLKYITIKRIAPLEDRIIRGSDHCEVQSIEDVCFKQMLRGEKTHEIANGDSVCVLSISEPIKNYVELEGAVCKPGKRELQKLTKTVTKLIEYGGDGLLDDAYMKRAEIYRLEKDQTRSLIRINLEKAFAGDPRHNIELQKGDILRVFHINEIIDTYQVSITGPVKDPGTYELLDDMTINDLLFKAGGLYDDVFKDGIYLERADLIRRQADGINDTTIAFNLEMALNNKGIGTELLMPYDRIAIYPRDISKISDKHVTISGYVENPGRYPYTSDMSLEDLVVAAGGFREGAFLESVELNRPIRHKTFTPSLYKFDYIHIPLLESYTIEKMSHVINNRLEALKIARNFQLQHRDIVRVKQDPDFKQATTVTLTGEVYFPGNYTMVSEDETLFNLLKRAGGLKPTAYLKGAKVTRNNQRLVVNMEELLEYEDDDKMLYLSNNDDIHIPRKPQQVTVSGNVGSIGAVQYQQGKRLWHYIGKRGGLREDTKYIYLIAPNGEIRKSRKFMGFYLCDPSCGFFLCNPIVEDGSEILVTKKPMEETATEGNVKQTISQTVTLATNTLIAILLLRQL